MKHRIFMVQSSLNSWQLKNHLNIRVDKKWQIGQTAIGRFKPD